MREETAEKYLARKNYHNIERSTFNAHLQHISGNKFILHKPIELPLIVAKASGHDESNRAVHAGEGSLVSPRVFVSLVEDLRKHKQSKQYLDAVEKSKPRKQDEERLSKRLRSAQVAFREGRYWAKQIEQGKTAKENLGTNAQACLEAFMSGEAKVEYDKLLDQQMETSRYLGAGAEIFSSMTMASVEQPASEEESESSISS